MIQETDDYTDCLHDVDRQYGSPAGDDLPSPQSYLNAFFAGGLLSAENKADIEGFLERYGSPDLNAGHRPVFAAFDTNLLPWRIASVLGLRQSGYWGSQPIVNGFALASGIRDELDWDHKHDKDDVRQLERAFGEPFSRLFNQPAGSNREGRLGGGIHYRQLRDYQYADEIETDALDAATLRLPVIGFLSFDDPRIQGTIDAVLEDLATDDGLVYRYKTSDGVEGEENPFVLCSFWLIDALTLSGRTEEAWDLFEGVLDYASPLGLFAEEIDPETGEQRGNFPQAFSHLGLINSALYLRDMMEEEPTALDPAPIGTSVTERGASD